jgi:hypothetical protein
VSNKDVKQDALDNLADALTEDILSTPDDELLREVEEDYGNPRALANKFDQILERAEKQVPQVRSSVLDLPISLPDETIRWVNGIFNLGSRLSEFLSSLRPRTLAWSATAAAVVILVQAAVITAVVVKEQGAPSEESLARKADRLPTVAVLRPDAAVQSPPLASSETASSAQAEPSTKTVETLLGVGPQIVVQSPPRVVSSAQPPKEMVTPLERELSGEEIEWLITRGRQSIVAGNIDAARLALKLAAEAGNATAALELGGTYDPVILREIREKKLPRQVVNTVGVIPTVADVAMIDPTVADVAMAKAWYEKARDLGSTEAAVRLKRLTGGRGTRR